MFKVRYFCFCPLLVLISGLISCSKDKDVRIQPDVFAPSELKVKRSDRSYQLAEDLRTVDLTSKLIIGSDVVGNSNSGPVVFKINSQCTNIQSNQSYPNEFVQVNQTEFSVINLIPKEILLFSKDVPIQCDFYLTAENSNRSTYTSSLKNITLTGIIDFNNINFDFINEAGAIYENYKSAIIHEAGETTIARFNCDELGSQLVSANSITLENMVAEQISENRSSQVQNCRILLLSENQIRLSPVFKLHMPVSPLQISSQVFPLEKLVGNIYQHKALEVKFMNTNSFSMKLRINNPTTSQYLFQPATQNVLLTNLTMVMKKEIKWIVNSAQPVETIDDHLEIKINPNDVITITAVVDLNINCDGSLAQFEAPPAIGFYAFGFEFNSEFIQEPYPGTQIRLDIPWQGEETHTSPLTNLNQWIFQFQEAGILTYRPDAAGNEHSIQSIKNLLNVCKDI